MLENLDISLVGSLQLGGTEAEKCFCLTVGIAASWQVRLVGLDCGCECREHTSYHCFSLVGSRVSPATDRGIK